MPAKAKPGTRIVKAVHGLETVDRDPQFEFGLPKFLSRDCVSREPSSLKVSTRRCPQPA
jgi:hypothetical protein